jgi:hypothetical protein
MSCNFFTTEETLVGDFLYKYIGKGTYLIYYNKTADRHMLLDVDVTLQVPFNFRLESITLCFDDATSKNITIYHIPMKNGSLAYPPRIFRADSDTHTDIIRKYSENWKFQVGDGLRFYIDGTTNKKCFPIIQLTRLIP